MKSIYKIVATIMIAGFLVSSLPAQACVQDEALRSLSTVKSLSVVSLQNSLGDADGELGAGLKRICERFDPEEDNLNRAIIDIHYHVVDLMLSDLFAGATHPYLLEDRQGVFSLIKKFKIELIRKCGIAKAQAEIYAGFTNAVIDVITQFDYPEDSSSVLSARLKSQLGKYSPRLNVSLQESAKDFIKEARGLLKNIIYRSFVGSLYKIRATPVAGEAITHEQLLSHAQAQCSQIDTALESHLAAYPRVESRKTRALAERTKVDLIEEIERGIEAERKDKVDAYMERLVSVVVEDFIYVRDIGETIEAIIAERPAVDIDPEEEGEIARLVDDLRGKVAFYNKAAHAWVGSHNHEATVNCVGRFEALRERSFNTMAELEAAISSEQEALPAYFIWPECADIRGAVATAIEQIVSDISEDIEMIGGERLSDYGDAVELLPSRRFESMQAFDEAVGTIQELRPGEETLDAQRRAILVAADQKLAQIEPLARKKLEDLLERTAKQRKRYLASERGRLFSEIRLQASHIDLMDFTAYERAKYRAIEKHAHRHKDSVLADESPEANQFRQRVAAMDERARDTVRRNLARHKRFDELPVERFPKLISVPYLVPGQTIETEDCTLILHRSSERLDYDPAKWDNKYFFEIRREGFFMCRLFFSVVANNDGAVLIKPIILLSEVLNLRNIYSVGAVEWLWQQVYHNQGLLEIYLVREEDVDIIPYVFEAPRICIRRALDSRANIFLLQHNFDPKALIRDRSFHFQMLVQGRPKSPNLIGLLEQAREESQQSVADRRLDHSITLLKRLGSAA